MNSLRRIAPLLVLALLAAAARPAAAQQDRKLTLAAYNVENMFDVFDNPYTDDEQTDVKRRDEIEAIAAAVKHTNADVIAFSEVENEGVLRAMVSEFLADQGYTYFACLPGNSGRGISLAVVSRVPIRSMTSHRYLDFTLPGQTRQWRFARDLLRVDLTVPEAPGGVLHLFVVHLKSKHDSDGDPDSANWRLAEATMAGKLISDIETAERDPWIAIVGDFNDLPDSAPLAAFMGTGDGQPGLVDAHADLPTDQRITYLKQPYRSTIDYVLVSPALHKQLDHAGVVSDPELLKGSDHAPLWATFNLPSSAAR